MAVKSLTISFGLHLFFRVKLRFKKKEPTTYLIDKHWQGK